MRHLTFAVACAAVLALSACATTTAPAPLAASNPVQTSPLAPAPAPSPVAEPANPITPAAIPAALAPLAPHVSREDFHAPPGWDSEDHFAALKAFVAGCTASKAPALAVLCRLARALPPYGETAARDFLESHFQAQPLAGDGLLTAYFAPEYPARASRQGEYTAALLGKPDDLQALDLAPYLTRAAIETAQPPVPAPILGWMKPEDLFFLQIQGSGVLTLPDGQRLKAAYLANNGQPFVAIANPMRQKNLLADNDTSGDSIRAWLAANRGPAGDTIMRLNPRYVFFRVAPDDKAGVVGAAGVILPPGRAIAVDTARHPLGGFYWIDASAPTLEGAFPSYRRAVMALDTGGAIKGEIRADLFLGAGDAAGREAGRVRHKLTLWRLDPR